MSRSNHDILNFPTGSAKRSPGEGEAERRKLPNRTQWVNWNPTRERLAIPGSEFCVAGQRGRHEAYLAFLAVPGLLYPPASTFLRQSCTLTASNRSPSKTICFPLPDQLHSCQFVKFCLSRRRFRV